MMLAYRLNYITNLFTLPWVIKKGHFMINFKPKREYKSSVKFGEWFGINLEYIKIYQNILFYNLYNKRVYQSGLKNVLTYEPLLLSLFTKPYKLNYFMNPIKIDVLRAYDLFYDKF